MHSFVVFDEVKFDLVKCSRTLSFKLKIDWGIGALLFLMHNLQEVVEVVPLLFCAFSYM